MRKESAPRNLKLKPGGANVQMWRLNERNPNRCSGLTAVPPRPSAVPIRASVASAVRGGGSVQVSALRDDADTVGRDPGALR